MDCEQSEKRMTISSKIYAPQVTHGLHFSYHKNRLMIPVEHLVNMGLNVLPSISGAFKVPWAEKLLQPAEGSGAQPKLSDAAVKKLAGNGMHLSCILPFMLFVFSRAVFTFEPHPRLLHRPG